MSPDFIDPITSAPGSQAAAMAAAAGITLTGTDRVMERLRIYQEAQIEPKTPFITELLGFFGTDIDNVNVVATKTQMLPLQEEAAYFERLKRISEFNLRGVTKVKYNPYPNRGRVKDKEENETSGTGEPGLARDLTTLEKLKRIPTRRIQEFAVAQAKFILGRPRDERDMIRLEVDTHLVELKEMGFTESDLEYLRQSVLKLLTDELAYLIRDTFLKQLHSPVQIAGWILKGKRGRDLIDVALSSHLIERLDMTKMRHQMVGQVEAQLSQKLQEGVKSLQDLVEIIKGSGISLNEWMREWTAEEIDVTFDPDLHLALGLRTERQRSILLDELRIVFAEAYLAPTRQTAWQKYWASRRLALQLIREGVSANDVKEIRFEARRIAWARSLGYLKEAHFHRIFSSSGRSFAEDSRRIETLSRRVRQLGHDIPFEGIRFVESELTGLALETARYKRDLLNSLQTLEPSSTQAQTILYLESLMKRLERKQNLELRFGRFFYLLSRLNPIRW